MRKYLKPSLCFLWFLLLIINSKNTTAGAIEGIEQCIQVIIPTLFPLLFLTIWMQSQLSKITIPGIRTLCRLLKIPESAQSLLLLGLIGGYPIGAQAIAQSYKEKQINKHTACILMGFCNNAGPAFILGISIVLFPNRHVGGYIWGIHLLSAIITGLILPKPKEVNPQISPALPISPSLAITRSIMATSSICGWIILVKATVTVFDCLPINKAVKVNLIALLELSTGCIELGKYFSPEVRFILLCMYISFGGFCVLLQTISVTEPFGIGLYLYGKAIQTSVSILLCFPVSYILFGNSTIRILPYISLIPVLIVFILILKWRSQKKLWKLCQL